MTDFASQGLPALFVVVLLGAVVPVVPTGAAVSAAAAVAFHADLLSLPFVLVAGALGAYAGDLVVYAACRAGGNRIARRMERAAGAGPDSGDGSTLTRTAARLRLVEKRLEEHQVTTLLVSRLIPGGRIPVLLAAAVAGYPWRRFATVDLSACAAWALVYAAIGVAGGAIFPEPWQGVVAALVIVVLVTAVGTKLRDRQET